MVSYHFVLLYVIGPIHTVLDISEHLRHMKSAAFDAQSQWRNISLSLGLSNSTMRIIYEPGSGECLHEVLSLWIQTGKDALYHLLKALENPMVARRDITHTIHARKEEERIKVSLDPAPEMDTGNKQPQGACDKISKVEVLIFSTRNYSQYLYLLLLLS